MKLEENMYVRTKNGKIRKIISLSFDETWKSVFVETHTWLKEKYIAKASHNIIDLIEVGDYVNGKEVTKINVKAPITKNKAIECDDTMKDGVSICYVYDRNDIKTILTKEQFEDKCYKIEN